MSRAFVKEQDGDLIPDDQPDLPQSPHPNYMTPGGLKGLEQRLSRLRDKQQRLADGPDDLLNKLPLAQTEREIRYIEGRIERAIVTDRAEQPTDEVCFGATVEVEDDAGGVRSFAIVGEDEADVEHGSVSWVSPLARALLGSGVGDTITWKRPSGDVDLKILSIRYPRT